MNIHQFVAMSKKPFPVVKAFDSELSGVSRCVLRFLCCGARHYRTSISTFQLEYERKCYRVRILMLRGVFLCDRSAGRAFDRIRSHVVRIPYYAIS